MDSSDYTPLSMNQINSLQNSCLSPSVLQNDLNKQVINNNNNNQKLFKNAYLLRPCDSLYEDQTSPMLFNQLELCKTLNRQKQYNILSNHPVEVINKNTFNEDDDIRNIDKIFQANISDSVSTFMDSKCQNNKSTFISFEGKLTDISTDNKHDFKQHQLLPVSKTSVLSSSTTTNTMITNNNNNNNNDCHSNKDHFSTIHKPKFKLFSTKKYESHKSNINIDHYNQLKGDDSQLIIDPNQITSNNNENSNNLPQITSSFV
ncbi:unnamed protein product [Schistosoma margrebowiei]|uniref:Uncharacterized protein n=1 Tax=Schistosoma margrebowiei TaxID=48269 RepID=A0A183M831_9TREM|nr:unnamed protein product [Schistosoma margrebowiei]